MSLLILLLLMLATHMEEDIVAMSDEMLSRCRVGRKSKKDQALLARMFRFLCPFDRPRDQMLNL